MRTLKKTLCLVLALVMVLGLGVNAFAITADDFTDLNQSKHEEAIRVLTAIGVVQGNGDGTLTPSKTLTRAQMASIITQLMGGLGSHFTATSAFTDLPKSHWGYNAIAFCEAHGILSGYGDGTVHPDADVTGYEVAKMMLSVIGYDMPLEVKDKDWKAVTYKYVTKLGLGAGLSLTYDYDKAIPRDDAFQLAFNTLQATMVDYNGSTNVTGPDFDVTITSGAKEVPITSEGARNYAGNGGPGAGYKQVCEEYHPTLKLNTGTDDDFGRPGHTWKNGRNVVCFVQDTPVDTYDSSFSKKEYDALVKKATNGAAGLSFVYNGVDITPTPAGDVYSSAMPNPAITGYEIEVYDDSTSTEVKYKIVICEAYLGHIDEITDKGDVKVTVYENNGNTSSVSKNTFTVKDENAIYDSFAGYTKGDYLAVYVTNANGNGTNWESAAGTADADDYIIGAAPLQKVEAKITRVDKGLKNNLSTVTADGTKYKVSNEAILTQDSGKNFKNNIILGSAGSIVVVGNATLYLYNGNILMVDQTEAPTPANSIYVVKEFSNANDQWGNPNKMFQGILPDGTVVVAEYDVSKAATDAGYLGSITSNTGYQYAINSETGAYRFKTAAGGTAAEGIVAITSSADNVAITSKDVKLNASADTVGGMYFASNVKFITVSGSQATLKVGVKTGAQNVTLKKAEPDYAVVTKDTVGNYVITAVYVINDGVVETAKDLIFIPGSGKISRSGWAYSEVDGTTKMNLFEVYLNGVKTLIPVLHSTDTDQLDVGWHEYSVSEKTGAYEVKNAPGSGVVASEEIATVTYVNDKYYVSSVSTLTAGDNYTAAADIPVIDTRTAKMATDNKEAKDMASLYELVSAKKDDGGAKYDVKIVAIYDSTDKTVSMIYVTSIAAK